jgi:hypothetical protein
MERYKCSLHDIITANCNRVVKQYCNSSISDDQHHQLLAASFLSELIAIRIVTDDSYWTQLLYWFNSLIRNVNCLTL